MRNIFMPLLLSILSSCIYFSCSQKLTPLKEDYVEPKGFWYFDPEFHLDSFDTKLQTEGLYFRILEEDSFGDNYQMFRFYKDGLVLEYSVYNTPDKVVKIPGSKAGNIHGYFKVDRDSVFFYHQSLLRSPSYLL